ncbi:MAG: hypothetical protein EZS28_028925, partial [Streblomastix strix]
TQGVVEALAEAQRVCLPGDRVSVTGCTERFTLSRIYSLAELRRLRKRFLGIAHVAASGTATRTELGDMFLAFLSQQGGLS